MTWKAIRTLAIAAGCWLWAGVAGAQQDNMLAAGVNVTHRMSPDPDVRGDDSIGIKVRIGHAETGWGWHYGLNWYATNLNHDVLGRNVRFGELKIRPFLGGYGYTHRLTDRMTITGDVIGGFGFSSISVAQQAASALQSASSQSVRVSTGLTPVVKPEVSVWYDLAERFGVSVDAGYILARPGLTIVTSGTRHTERIRADAFTISTGIVYRLF